MKTKLSRFWKLKGCEIAYIKRDSNQKPYQVELCSDNRLFNKLNLPPLVTELLNIEYNRGKEEAKKEILTVLGIKT